jgi:hypothetical protein
MAERRKQGLCYNCDEPYVQGHKCACLFYLEAADYIVQEPDSDSEDEEAAADATPAQPTISLSAIAGIPTAQTMQIYVQVGGEQCIALLDSGSTHNFISGEVAHRAGIRFRPCPSAGVTVANGDRLDCRGVAHDVSIRIADEAFVVDCYTIPLDRWDMVLGITFLRTLGPILWDFDDLCMAFTCGRHRVFWRDIGSMRYDVQSTRLYAMDAEKPLQTPCLPPSTTSSLIRKACLQHGRVITASIYCPIRPRWQCAPSGIPNSRRMNWKCNVQPCYSRGSSDPAHRCSRLPCSW